MILKCFSLQDMKAGMFSTPFYYHQLGQAVRGMMDLLSDNNSLPARHPADFQLWELGFWDDQTGVHHNELVCHGSLVAYLPTPQPSLPGA